MKKMVLLTLLTITGAAARADDNGNHPRPHGPPPEAFTACEQKNAGDSCQVTFQGHDNQSHTIDGTCAAPPDGGSKLACRPNHPPGPPPDQASP